MRVHFFILTFLFFAFSAQGVEDRPCRPTESSMGKTFSRSLAQLEDDLRIAEDLNFGGDSFCSEWNPEYKFNGGHCCAKKKWGKKRAQRCPSQRKKSSFCDEMTDEQKQYTQGVVEGKYSDLLALIQQDKDRNMSQAICDANNGFLAFGRPVLSTSENRIKIRNPNRCTNFGTDPMVGMLEWTGKEVSKEFPEKVKLLVGDVSAPRGGCLRGARKGHASHTNGQDADIGFLVTKPGREEPDHFVGLREFEPQTNWWFLKKIFKNPFACIKVIFLDQRLINKLYKVAHQDEEWSLFKKFIRHARGHYNHFHVRVGDAAGAPGCVPNANPSDEVVDDQDAEDVDPASVVSSAVSDQD